VADEPSLIQTEK